MQNKVEEMARVTDTEVKEIFATTRDTTPFIETATLLVDEELVGSGLSDNRLTQIELYLAAHLASTSINHGGLKSRKIGDSEEEYRGPVGSAVGMLSSPYGQQAVALDSTGTLGTLSKSTVKAEFRVV